VRGLALTGSVAADDAGDDADVDLLVIVAPARLGIVFLLLGSLSRLLGRRLFCPNYYVCADHLGITRSSVYVARELVQARSLAGGAEALRDANPWLREMFPNAFAGAAPNGGPRAASRLQRLLEAPLGGRFGDHIERWARRVAAARLRAHYSVLGGDVPADVAASFEAGAALRFHARDVAETTLERYMAQREQLALRLEQIDRVWPAA
jgi:hypothetical protein